MLSIGLMHGVLAQSDPFNAPIYPERLHEDLAVLHRVIDEVHPDPYRYRSHEALNALFDSLELAIRVPMPAEAFAQVLLPVLEAVGDMHLRVDLPRTFEEHVDARVPLLPLDVVVLEPLLADDDDRHSHVSSAVSVQTKPDAQAAAN